MQYRREIDGLRAVAVLPVILFHAGFSFFSGGYVGVDVFFVISGYLITSILLADLERDDFSIARFYERRARRILPALSVVMLACLPFAWAWMLPEELKTFTKTIVSVVVFASNIFFAREKGYFAPVLGENPLLHTWSLAVEEQYYLIFPIFLFLLWRFGRKRLTWAIALTAVASLLYCEWGWRHEPAATFFLAPPRAWELLTGSLLALHLSGRAPHSSNLLAAAGLALIAFAVVHYDEHTPFPSLYAVAPVLGTALFILFAGDGTWVRRVLSTSPCVGIGLISYSAYLWHQPLFAFARIRILPEPSQALMIAMAAASLLLGWASWRFVETPFRTRSIPVLAPRRNVFTVFGAAGAVFLLIGLAGHLEIGLDRRSSDGQDMRVLEKVLEPNYGLNKKCNRAFNTAPECHTAPAPQVLLWGDSFAMQLADGIVASRPGIALQQQTYAACAPIVGIAQLQSKYTVDWAKDCIAFNDQVLEWLRRQTSVKLVVLSSPFFGVLGGSIIDRDGNRTHGEAMDQVSRKLVETVTQIRQAGARVVIVSPTPLSGYDTGACLVRSEFFGESEDICDFPLRTDSPPNDMLRGIEDQVAVYWLYNDICRDGKCFAAQDGVLLYRDILHLSTQGSAHLGRKHEWMRKFEEIARYKWRSARPVSHGGVAKAKGEAVRRGLPARWKNCRDFARNTETMKVVLAYCEGRQSQFGKFDVRFQGGRSWE